MKKVTALVLALTCTMGLAGCSTGSASVGIIGGADGPTAIFVTSNVNWGMVCCLAGIVLVAALIVLIICRKKK